MGIINSYFLLVIMVIYMPKMEKLVVGDLVMKDYIVKGKKIFQALKKIMALSMMQEFMSVLMV